MAMLYLDTYGHVYLDNMAMYTWIHMAMLYLDTYGHDKSFLSLDLNLKGIFFLRILILTAEIETFLIIYISFTSMIGLKFHIFVSCLAADRLCNPFR